MNPKSFSPLALTEGRIARGYNKAQLATAIGVTRQAISLIEKGGYEPKPETLSKISDILELPQRYFFRNPIEDFSKETPVFFRELSKTTDMLHERANVKAKWHYNGYLELTKYLKQIEKNLPNFCFQEGYDFTKLTEEDIENYAKELRKFWGLNLSPIIGLSPLLEKNGILVFQIDVKADINGFSFYANGSIPFIFCVKNVPAGRNRFNLAHELGHILLHAIADKNELNKHHKLFEDQANYFAGAFLFPKERFFDEFFSTDLNYLINLKQRWGMSMGAIIKRALNLEMLDDNDVGNFYKRNPGIRKKEPLDEEIEVEQPTFPHNGLRALLDAGLTTVDDLKTELPYNNEDLAEMFCVEKSLFETNDENKVIANIIEFKRKD